MCVCLFVYCFFVPFFHVSVTWYRCFVVMTTTLFKLIFFEDICLFGFWSVEGGSRSEMKCVTLLFLSTWRSVRGECLGECGWAESPGQRGRSCGVQRESDEWWLGWDGTVCCGCISLKTHTTTLCIVSCRVISCVKSSTLLYRVIQFLFNSFLHGAPRITYL